MAITTRGRAHISYLLRCHKSSTHCIQYFIENDACRYNKNVSREAVPTFPFEYSDHHYREYLFFSIVVGWNFASRQFPYHIPWNALFDEPISQEKS